MSPGSDASPVLVLLAAAGAGWEAEAVDRLTRAGRQAALSKRCVDLPDLLATAGSGTGAVAVLSPTLPGLDADSIEVLRRHGLALVLVADPGALLDGDTERLRRLGVEHVLVASELSALVETVREAAADAGGTGPEPEPGAEVAALQADTVEASTAGRLVAVWGPAGAPGRTTVAVGLASELAEAGHEVLLLDVDAYGGAVGQHLGVLDEVSGLLAAARAANAGRLDAATLSGCARQVAPRLRVLTGLPRPDRWTEVRPVAFADLLDQAVRVAPYTLLDLAFSLESDPADPFAAAPQRNHMTLTALERADEVVVVGAADPVGLARLARGLVELHDLLPALRPRVVVNRTRASLGWNDREIAGMVEGFVRPLDVAFLPDDRAAADRALMAGRSLAESGESALQAAMAQLARAVAGAPAAPSATRALRRRRAGRDR